MSGTDSPNDKGKGSWLEENVLHPAANSLKEAANTGINLVNIALPESAKVSKYEIKHNEPQTVVGMLVSGAVSVVPPTGACKNG